MLKEYYDDIGGRPERPSKATKATKGTKRKDTTTTQSDAGTPAPSSKRSKKATEPVEKAWSPPPGSWEDDVSHIDTVEQSIDPRTGKDAKFAYIVWNNQKKTQHPLKHIYTKCPQKVDHTQYQTTFCLTDSTRCSSTTSPTSSSPPTRKTAQTAQTAQTAAPRTEPYNDALGQVYKKPSRSDEDRVTLAWRLDGTAFGDDMLCSISILSSSPQDLAQA